MRSGLLAIVAPEYRTGATRGNVRRAPITGRRAAVASRRQGGAPERPPGVVQASTSDRTRSR